MSATSCVEIVTSQQDEKKIRAKANAASQARRRERRLVNWTLQRLQRCGSVENDRLQELQNFKRFRQKKNQYLKKMELVRCDDIEENAFEVHVAQEVIPVRCFYEINGSGNLTLDKVKTWVARLLRTGIRKVMLRFSNPRQLKKLRGYLEFLKIEPIATSAIPGHVLIKVA